MENKTGTNFLPFYKRTFIINRQYQVGFVLRLLGLVLAGAGVFMAVFYLLSQGMMSVSYEHYDLRVGEASNMLMPQVLSATLIYVMLTGLTVTVITILTSHRMAGPIYRIARVVESMHKGNLGLRIRLRRKDNSGDLAAALNGLMDAYADQIFPASKAISEILDYLAHLRDKGAAGPEEMAEIHSQLKLAHDRLTFFYADAGAEQGH